MASRRCCYGLIASSFAGAFSAFALAACSLMAAVCTFKLVLPVHLLVMGAAGTGGDVEMNSGLRISIMAWSTSDHLSVMESAETPHAFAALNFLDLSVSASTGLRSCCGSGDCRTAQHCTRKRRSN